MEKMAQERIDEKLQEQSEWSQIGDSIQRTYRFDDFLGAMTFVRRVAELAESQQHHPDIALSDIEFDNAVQQRVTTIDLETVTAYADLIADDYDQFPPLTVSVQVEDQ